MDDHAPTENDLREEIEAAQEARRAFEAYNGIEYLIKDWMEDGTPYEQAVAEIQDPLMLSLLMHLNGLEYILADKHATAGLKKLLIQRDARILKTLASYNRRVKPKGKPGPRPREGKYLKDRIAELDRQGLSDGKIAVAIYGSSKMRNRVAAHLNQAKKRQAGPPTMQPQPGTPQQ